MKSEKLWYFPSENGLQSVAEGDTMKKLNFNEMVAFLSRKLNMPEERFAKWLDDEA